MQAVSARYVQCATSHSRLLFIHINVKKQRSTAHNRAAPRLHAAPPVPNCRRWRRRWWGCCCCCSGRCQALLHACWPHCGRLSRHSCCRQALVVGWSSGGAGRAARQAGRCAGREGCTKSRRRAPLQRPHQDAAGAQRSSGSLCCPFAALDLVGLMSAANRDAGCVPSLLQRVKGALESSSPSLCGDGCLVQSARAF